MWKETKILLSSLDRASYKSYYVFLLFFVSSQLETFYFKFDYFRLIWFTQRVTQKVELSEEKRINATVTSRAL